MHLLTFGGMNC